MHPAPGHFLRDNLFLVAAAALPLLVVGFFLLATAVPRWTVPPPAYDLVLRAGTYDQSGPRVAVDFRVRDGRVEATVRPLPPTGYPQRVALFVFDHATMQVHEVPFEPPDLAEGDPPRTIVIEALADRRVIAQGAAPDGYELASQARGGPGLVGQLFGMGRSRQRVALVNRGRVVPIELPAPYDFQYSPTPYLVGWLADEGAR